MFKKIKKILINASSQYKSIAFIYIIQLIVASYIGLVVFNNLDATIGDSLSTDILARGFDRSVFSDIINNYPEFIANIKSPFFISIIIYLLLSIFLNGGLIFNINKENKSIFHFIKNGVKYYFSFLVISFLSILLIAFILAIIFIPFLKFIGDPLETFSSEKSFIITLFILMLISILLIGIVWILSVLSRLNIAEGKSLKASLQEGLMQLKMSFNSYFLFTITILLFHVFITWFYAVYINDWGADTWSIVIALISIQQIFVIVRIWLRCVAYQGIKSFSSNQ